MFHTRKDTQHIFQSPRLWRSQWCQLFHQTRQLKKTNLRNVYHWKSISSPWIFFRRGGDNVFNNIFCVISSNYTVFKSNINTNFLPDELIIACSLAHIDHSICLILISFDLLDEGKPHDYGRRKMIQNDSQQHRKTSKPRNNSYKTPKVYKNWLHNVVISYRRTFAIEKTTIIICLHLHFFGMNIQLNHSLFIRLKSILFQSREKQSKLHLFYKIWLR